MSIYLQIPNLTKRQAFYAEYLWEACETEEQVEKFIDLLSDNQEAKADAELVYELLKHEIIDMVTSVATEETIGMILEVNAWRKK